MLVNFSFYKMRVLQGFFKALAVGLFRAMHMPGLQVEKGDYWVRAGFMIQEVRLFRVATLQDAGTRCFTWAALSERNQVST